MERRSGQGLFGYLGLDAVFGIPIVEPRIFALSSVSKALNTICALRADVLTLPKLAAGELSHDFSN
jgi:hypothetical protein